MILLIDETKMACSVLTSVLGLCSGVAPPALTLWDVDGDSVEDVLLAVTEWSNETHTTQRNKSELFKYFIRSAFSQSSVSVLEFYTSGRIQSYLASFRLFN